MLYVLCGTLNCRYPSCDRHEWLSIKWFIAKRIFYVVVRKTLSYRIPTLALIHTLLNIEQTTVPQRNRCFGSPKCQFIETHLPGMVCILQFPVCSGIFLNVSYTLQLYLHLPGTLPLIVTRKRLLFETFPFPPSRHPSTSHLHPGKKTPTIYPM